MMLGLMRGAFAAEISAEYGPAEYADIAASTYARMLLYKKGNGVVAAANEKGLYGLVDLSGRVISDFRYEGMWVLDGGLFKYSNSTDPNDYTWNPDQSIQQGVMDSNGNILLPMGPYQIHCYNKTVSVFSYYSRETQYYTLDWEPISTRTLSIANDAPYVPDTDDEGDEVIAGDVDRDTAEDMPAASEDAVPDEVASDDVMSDDAGDSTPAVDTGADNLPAADGQEADEGVDPADTTDMAGIEASDPMFDAETAEAEDSVDVRPIADDWQSGYDEVRYEADYGFCIVLKDDMWGVADMDGTLLVPLNSGLYSVSGPNPEQYIVVSSGASEMENTVSYLLKDHAVANTFEGRKVSASVYCRNLVFTTGGNPECYGLMDINGNVLMEERYGEIYGHPDGYYHTYTSEGSNTYTIYHGLYSQDGECILEDVYTALYKIADQRYMVCRDGKYGVMAVAGTAAVEVIPVEYDDFDLYGYQFNIFTKGNADIAYTLDGEILMASDDKIDVFASELFGGSSSVWDAYYDLYLARGYDGYSGNVLPFIIRTSGTDSGYATYYVDVQIGDSAGYIPYRASNINEDGYFIYQDKNGKYGIGGINGLPDSGAALPDGVKYVPYSCFIGDNKDLDFTWGENGEYLGGNTWCEISSGVLPSGLMLNEVGEITGVPMASGEFTFTVMLGNADGAHERQLTLTILDNTNSAVMKPNDYPITDPVGTPDPYDPNHFYKYDYRTETLRIDGPYSEFMRLLIDGREKRRGIDYEAHEGSTVITIYGETFEETGSGTHTIAAEFREGGEADGTLKTVAQNYTIQLPSAPSNPGTGGNYAPSTSAKPTSKPESKPTQTPAPDPEPETPQLPETPQASGFPFGDVLPSDWFYDDVKWAYENEMMTGVSETRFAPEDDISQATIVTVLARLAGVDLSAFTETNDPSIESGKWYSAAAIWAKQSGLLPDYSSFTGEEKIPREQMAIMLVKYMQSLGMSTIQPENVVEFQDADQMSSAGNTAFQVLYRDGIFKGVGDNRMDPGGVTSRAQFAALTHRISVFVETS